jgi:SNF2-related domain
MADSHQLQYPATFAAYWVSFTRQWQCRRMPFLSWRLSRTCNRTPLQNNLMELWSLLHFLMPYVFRSRKEFSFWFANPMNNIIEGNASKNDDVIRRLHGIIRPFVLRRLKKDVETQMPGKFEHIVKCHLSRRQVRGIGDCVLSQNLVAENAHPRRYRCSSTKSSWQGRRRDRR